MLFNALIDGAIKCVPTLNCFGLARLPLALFLLAGLALLALPSLKPIFPTALDFVSRKDLLESGFQFVGQRSQLVHRHSGHVVHLERRR
jgi:hypothetical protein